MFANIAKIDVVALTGSFVLFCNVVFSVRSDSVNFRLYPFAGEQAGFDRLILSL